MIETKDILKRAKEAKSAVSMLSEDKKNEILNSIADELEANCADILAANAEDVSAAEGRISDVMIDRLRLNEKRIADMAQGVRDVAKLPDPIGKAFSEYNHKNGLKICRVRVPMGVVAIIYESRPNVTSDAAALAIKSSNVCVLRTGKEAFRSAYAIVKAIKKGIEKTGVTPDFVNLIEDTTHAGANEMMTAVGYIDLLIPRGGAGLIRACVENAKVPCIQTGTGICHIYVDESADTDMALKIIENAKTSRPSVCNAEEVLIVNRKIAKEFLPKLKALLVDKRKAEGKIPVELRLDGESRKIIDGTPAGENDFDTEFLDYILAVKIVGDVKEACEHISAHSTGHSEAIITENKDNSDYFTKVIDSSALYVNCSTRFTDGGEFGLGCEMGISTQKLHARGPMGIEELTTYKYVINGNGQIR